MNLDGPMTTPKALLYLFVSLALFFLMLPNFMVFPFSISPTSMMEFPPRGFSTQWYEKYFTQPGWVEATWTSFYVAIITMIISVVIGSLAAYGLVRSRPSEGDRRDLPRRKIGIHCSSVLGHKYAFRFPLNRVWNAAVMVQIFERPSIGGNRPLAIAIAESWLRTSEIIGCGAMEAVMRRATKILRLRNEILDLALLTKAELESTTFEALTLARTVD